MEPDKWSLIKNKGSKADFFFIASFFLAFNIFSCRSIPEQASIHTEIIIGRTMALMAMPML